MSSRLHTEPDFAAELPTIFAAMSQLRELEAQLNDLFPQRDFLIRQMILAVLTRMNVLNYGTYGTGKSFLIKQFMEGIGAKEGEVFSIELTRYTAESDLFGPIDVPAMREEGVQRRNPDNTIREARFADLGELLDAQHLLRSLLGILNERYYSRGADSGPVPLHTAFASTNVDPVDLLKKYPNGDAVIDRFVFQSTVGWLTDHDDLLTIMRNFRSGITVNPRVDHEALLAAAGLVSKPTDQIDPTLLDTVVEIALTARREVEDFRAFSDRAFCLWLPVLEANAILNGRYKVVPADLWALKYVICNGLPEQERAFDVVIRPIIEEAVARHGAMSVDDAILMAIQAIKTSYPSGWNSLSSANDLVAYRRRLEGHLSEVRKMRPELESTEREVRSLNDRLAASVAEVEDLIVGG